MSIIVKGLRRLFNGRGEGDNEFLLDNPWQHVDFTQAYHAATDDDASSMRRRTSQRRNTSSSNYRVKVG